MRSGSASGGGSGPSVCRLRGSHPARNRKFADSPLEEAVSSEPVSGIPIPWLLGKIQGNSLELRCSPLGTRDRSRAYTLNSLVTKQGIFQGIADNWRAISGQFFDASG